MTPSHTANLLALITSILESNGVDVSLDNQHCFIWIYNGCFEPVGRIKLFQDNLILYTRGETHAHIFSLHDSKVIKNIIEKACKLAKD